jgi:hypothetical protein
MVVVTPKVRVAMPKTIFPLFFRLEIACIVERRLRAIITVVIEWQGSYREARESSMRPVAPAVTPMMMATALVLAIMELRKFFRLDTACF